MNEIEKASNYYVRVKEIINKMLTLRETLRKALLIKKIMRSLTNKWNHIIVIFEDTKDLSQFEIESIIGSLMSHEERLDDEPVKPSKDKKAFTTKECESRSNGKGTRRRRIQ